MYLIVQKRVPACVPARQKKRQRYMSIQNEISESPGTGASQPPAPDYENKQQLAARLGVCVRTIDNLLAHGLPHLKLTRKLIRFPRAAVDQWLAERHIRRA